MLRALTSAALALLLSGVAQADWLVTVDGQRLETRGPWKIEGRRVIFTLPNGTLSALRTTQVDLEASAAASTELKPSNGVEDEPSAEGTSVLVLRSSDVASARRGGTSPMEQLDSTGPDAALKGAPGEVEGAALESTDERIVVDRWEEDGEVRDGTRIIGALRNPSTVFATSLKLLISLHDEDGALIEQKLANLDSLTAAPGAEVGFEVQFPSLYAYRDVRFGVDYRGFRTAGEPGGQVGDPEAGDLPIEGSADGLSPEGDRPFEDKEGRQQL